MRTHMTELLAIAALTMTLGLGTQARAADILFTVTGTINNAGSDPTLLGYTNGQAVTFSWVLNDYAPATPVGSIIDPDRRIQWFQEQSIQPVLISDAGGTGLTGTFTPSSGNNPNSYITLNPSTNNFSIWAAADSGNIGLQSPNGMTLSALRVSSATISPYLFADPGTLPNPASYFANYFGSRLSHILTPL